MVVVEVAAAGVRVQGGASVPPELARAALTWMDDPIGLLGDQPVPTPDLWRAVLSAAAGGPGTRCASMVVVHPVGWPALRVRRILDAAESVAVRVEARSDSAYRSRSAPKQRSVRSLGVLGALLVLAGGAVALATRAAPPPSVVSLVDGPVAVLIPADWTVERRAAGTGSSRVRVGSSADPEAAVNITWSYAPQTTLAEIEAAARRAAAAEPAGVFDFDGSPAGRPAVAYRETRPGRIVHWSVLIDGSIRIAIGCQSAPGREAAVRAACEQAVRTARAF